MMMMRRGGFISIFKIEKKFVFLMRAEGGMEGGSHSTAQHSPLSREPQLHAVKFFSSVKESQS